MTFFLVYPRLRSIIESVEIEISTPQISHNFREETIWLSLNTRLKELRNHV